MVGFGLVLFVFLFLITFDLMFKYINSETLKIDNIHNIFYILFPMVFYLFVSFVGEFIYIIGKEVLYNKKVEYVGFLFEDIFIIPIVAIILNYILYVIFNISNFIKDVKNYLFTNNNKN